MNAAAAHGAHASDPTFLAVVAVLMWIAYVVVRFIAWRRGQ